MIDYNCHVRTMSLCNEIAISTITIITQNTIIITVVRMCSQGKCDNIFSNTSFDFILHLTILSVIFRCYIDSFFSIHFCLNFSCHIITLIVIITVTVIIDTIILSKCILKFLLKSTLIVFNIIYNFRI